MNKKHVVYILYVLSFIIVMNLGRMLSSINSLLKLEVIIAIIGIIYIYIYNSIRKEKIALSKGLIIFICFSLSYLSIGLIKTNIQSIIGHIIYLNLNIFLIFIIGYSIKNKEYLKKLLKIIKYSGVVLAILGILEFFQVISIQEIFNVNEYIYRGRVSSMWLNPNLYGLALVFSLICSFQEELSIKEITLKGIIYIGILLSMSRSALLISSLCVSINIILNRKIKIRKIINSVITISICTFMLSFFINNNQELKSFILDSRINRLNIFKSENTNVDVDNGRIEALLEATKLGIENPIIGVGINNIPLYSTESVSAHNMYINILAESGFIPFYIYMILIFYIFNIMIKSYKNSSQNTLIICLGVMLFVYGFFNHTLITNPIIGLSIGVIFCMKDITINKNITN